MIITNNKLIMLPNEILLDIYEYLSVEDAFHFSLVNRQLNLLFISNQLWKFYIERDLLITVELEISDKNKYFELKKLEKLKQIWKLNYELIKLSYLKELYLSNNNISVIPPEIGQLSQLEKLDLSNNKISIIPSEIEQLSQLKELYLFLNNISVIPPDILYFCQTNNINFSY